MLEREGGVTIEELLEEDDLLNECKASNPQVCDYICNKQVLSKLIDFITKAPIDPTNRDLTYK